MSKGNFKQLVRTLRNWRNEGIQIKQIISSIPKGTEGKEGNIRPDTNNHPRKE